VYGVSSLLTQSKRNCSSLSKFIRAITLGSMSTVSIVELSEVPDTFVAMFPNCGVCAASVASSSGLPPNAGLCDHGTRRRHSRGDVTP
jgi:hypothetical protein